MDAPITIDGPLQDGTYRGRFPALPGCVVYGFSREEALARCQQAVVGYSEHLAVVLPRELARLWRQARRPRVPQRALPMHTGLVGTGRDNDAATT